MSQKIAVVIVTYNCSDFIESLIEKLADINYPKDMILVIFIDNASSDDTYLKLVKECNRLIKFQYRIIRLSRNIGFPAALRIGITSALNNFDPEYVIVMNPDMEIIDKNFVNIMLRAAKSEKVCLVAPTLVRGSLNKTQYTLGLLDIFGSAYMGLYGISVDSLGRVKRLGSVLFTPWATFALAMINVKCLRDIGLPCSKFFLYYEDVEYSLRAITHGYLVVSILEPVARHAEGGSRKPYEIRWLARSFFVRNSLLVTLSYLGLMPFMFRLFLYVLQTVINSKERGPTIYGIFNALRYLVRNPKVVNLRMRIPGSLLVRRNNLLVMALKYRDLDRALRAFSIEGTKEYLKNIRKAGARHNQAISPA